MEESPAMSGQEREERLVLEWRKEGGREEGSEEEGMTIGNKEEEEKEQRKIGRDQNGRIGLESKG